MSGISAQYCDGLELRIKELEAENAALRAELAAAKEYHEAYREEMLEQLGELAALKAGDVVMVPREILDRFQELNPNNYDHDDVCNLNAWAVELVLAAAPGVQAGEKDNAEITGG